MKYVEKGKSNDITKLEYSKVCRNQKVGTSVRSEEQMPWEEEEAQLFKQECERKVEEGL